MKPNLGHSEAVSGISSIIKVVLALEKRTIPPTIGIQTINPALKLEDNRMVIATKLMPWPTSISKRLRASVNSFGYGGANAHAILEREDSLGNLDAHTRPQENHVHDLLLPFSAKSQHSLVARVADLKSLPQHFSLHDLAYTLTTRRSHFDIRGFMVLESSTRFQDLSTDSLHTQIPQARGPRFPLAYLFTGQGAQWPGMSSELVRHCSIYRASLQRLDDALAKLSRPPSWKIIGTFLEWHQFSY